MCTFSVLSQGVEWTTMVIHPKEYGATANAPWCKGQRTMVRFFEDLGLKA